MPPSFLCPQAHRRLDLHGTTNTVNASNLTYEHIFWSMWLELFSLAIEDDSADGIHFCIIFPSVSKVFMRKCLK